MFRCFGVKSDLVYPDTSITWCPFKMKSDYEAYGLLKYLNRKGQRRLLESVFGCQVYGLKGHGLTRSGLFIYLLVEQPRKASVLLYYTNPYNRSSY